MPCLIQQNFNRILSLVILAAGISSCGNYAITHPVDYFVSVSDAHIHAVANLDAYGCMMPVGIAVRDSVLYVQTTTKEILKKIGLRTGTVDALLLHGNGPTEMLSPSYLTVSTKRATVADCNRKIALEINMTPDHGSVSFSELPAGYGPYISVVAGNGCFILTGLFESGRYMHYDRNTGNVRFFGDYRLGKDNEDLRNYVRSQAYMNSKLGIRPDLKRFAAINFNCGVIDINEMRNDSIVLVKAIDFHYPEIVVKRDGVAQSLDNRNGFIDIACSEDLLYVIYSGKTYRDAGPDFSLCDYLMSFDWDGNPVACYELPVPFCTICYDAVNSKLYGVHPGEATILYEVSLK